MEQNNSHTVHDSLNVFDDEFAVDDFDFVGDGFAPGRINDVESDNDERREPAIRSVAAHMADMPIRAASPLSRRRGDRSSIRKSRDADNPFRSVEDDDDNDNDQHSMLGRTPSIRSQSTVTYAPGITHRSVSSTSSRAFAPTQSAAASASGPSHPYAMYPQGTNLARTASVSTTSTIRPQRPLMEPQGPAHPYGMYPQNVSEDDDEESQDPSTSHVQAHIPVGFPGRTQAFHRQQGPEGEEHDIIGLDGHTEQLPPYSEYPEDGAPKHIVLPNATATVTPPNGTQLTIPLVSGRPQSMSDAGNGGNPLGFGHMEQMESNDSSASVPKSWREKTWKEKRKTQFCGIPFWWILLSACVLAFIAIVLGGAIGGFMSSQKKAAKNRQHHGSQSSSTALYDASPIPTSSTGAPPATGTYALTLSTAEAVQAECLTNQTYANAWSCNMAGQQSLGIDVEDPPSGSSGWQGASFLDTCPSNSYINISYGTQTPSTSFAQFVSVTDEDDTSRGPAFHFQTFYDKVVVAPPDAFSHNYKRDQQQYDMPPKVWGTRHQIIAAATKPWFCYWNGTLIEGYIYSTNVTNSSSPSSTSSSSLSASNTGASSHTYTATSTAGQAASTIMSSSSAYSSLASRAIKAARSYTGDYYGQLPHFDYVVKIEERRIQGSPQPYCQQMQILDDGTAGIVTDPSTGGPITITLGEEDPTYSAETTSASSSSSKLKRADTTAHGCHCQWWSGAG